MALAEVRYAPARDGSRISYTATGDGPLTLVMTPSLLARAELLFEEPTIVRFLLRLTARVRLLVMDRRGTGFSDRPAAVDDLGMERLREDVDAVLDHAGVGRAALLSECWGGPVGSTSPRHGPTGPPGWS